MNMGYPSACVSDENDQYPPEKGEAMTTAALYTRLLMEEELGKEPILKKHAELMRKKLPILDVREFGTDMYYWYYGTCGMKRMGGVYWDTWNKAMKPAALLSRHKDGHHAGSWDPNCACGLIGGRVYSTAMMVLCLEVYFRG
jgi:hypothetical protein